MSVTLKFCGPLARARARRGCYGVTSLCWCTDPGPTLVTPGIRMCACVRRFPLKPCSHSAVHTSSSFTPSFWNDGGRACVVITVNVKLGCWWSRSVVCVQDLSTRSATCLPSCSSTPRWRLPRDIRLPAPPSGQSNRSRRISLRCGSGLLRYGCERRPRV